MPKTTSGVDRFRSGDFSGTSIEAVGNLLAPYLFVKFHRGFIPNTFADLQIDQIAWAHIDVDIYQSVHDCIGYIVAPFTVLLAFYVEGHLKASPDWYGFLVAGMGMGMIAGFVVSGALKLSPRQNGRAIVVTIVGQSLAMTALALATTPSAALALFTLAGVMNGFTNVRFTTLLQLATAVEMRGRVFGLLRTVTEGLIPVATILAGIVADLTGRNIPLVYAGCGIALTCISLALAASPSCRAFLAGDVAPSATPVRADAPAVTAGAGG